MNFTKTLPMIQEELFKHDCKEDIVALVNTLSGEECENGIIMLGSGIPSFMQTHYPKTYSIEQQVGTKNKPIVRKVNEICIQGCIRVHNHQILLCPHCGKPLVKNGKAHTVGIQHIPLGDNPMKLLIDKQSYRCSNDSCKYFYDERIDFKSQYHFITTALEIHIENLLKQGLTAKKIASMCHVSKNIVHDIHKRYLQEKYTVNGEGNTLKRPVEFCKYLGVDEFLLHKGYKYATVIMDLETNHILYLAYGKKKQVIYDFIEWIGMDWMKNVKAIACDMNSDFEEAFKEKCNWIKVVFDRFHIVKNFNEKVISNVRKDIQKQMIEEGDIEGAKSLKGSKYILMSNRETLLKKEQETVKTNESVLFKKPAHKPSTGKVKRYEELIQKNELLLLIDMIKEQLKKAYETTNERSMKIHINKIIRYCKETSNKHFEWFARLIEKHIDGILTHAKLPISSGKVEGMNNMIKTVRRQGYGYPDDEYFFLLIMDASRKDLHWS